MNGILSTILRLFIFFQVELHEALDNEITYFCKHMRPDKELKFPHTDVDLCLLLAWVHDHLKSYFLLAQGEVSSCFIRRLLRTNLLRQRQVEVVCSDHLIVRIYVSKHDLFGLCHHIFVMEDEEGVSLHVHLYQLV